MKIVYLSGQEAAAGQAAKSPHLFDKEDVAAVRNSCLVAKNSASDYKGVDILLTSQWPYNIVENEVST